jgi:hypothetical protein
VEVTAHAQAASASPVYSRRQPGKTALYKVLQVLQQHLLTFEQQWTAIANGVFAVPSAQDLDRIRIFPAPLQ